MCFRGSTNLKTVLGTLENTLKIKSMVTALLYTQMDQDMKVKCAHKADFCVVELWFGGRTCLWMLGCTRERHVLQITQSLNKHKLTGLTQKPESLVINELAPVGNLSVPAASAACEPVC